MRTDDEIGEQIELACSLLQQMINDGFDIPTEPEKVTYISLRTTLRTLLWIIGYDFDEITALIAKMDSGGELLLWK